VQYDWDDAKAALNLRKHGVDFMDAIAAVEDPNHLADIDERYEYGEEQLNIIGMADRVLFVVVTMRAPGSCRIISARKATRHEQDRYYAGDHQAR
jgi:uncharacterized protein